MLSTSLRKKLVLRRAIPPFRAQLFLKVVISSSIVVICINASCFKEDDIACCQGPVPPGKDFTAIKKKREKGILKEAVHFLVVMEIT